MGKLIISLTRFTGSQGTVFPGKIARILHPDILHELAKNILEEIIVITGTNGKTTTSNMVAQILKEHNYSLVHNEAGANMLAGITTAFIAKTNLWGTKLFDYALLETDEANLPLLLKEITPKLVLITNFFNDQLDRFGEVDYIIDLIKDAVRNTNIELVLNADDPLVTHFQRATGLHCWYYGFRETDYDKSEDLESKVGKYCAFCGHQLVFEKYHYAQLGKFHCPNCASKNPEPNFVGHNLQMNPTISFSANDIFLESPYQGFYNAYNILAAVSIAKLVGLQDNFITEAIRNYQPQAGRMESFFIQRKEVILILVKNPIGLNQALEALGNNPDNKNILFILNDKAGDGRDVSWVWEANLELITAEGFNIEAFVCSGSRSGDIALRVKYAGYPESSLYLADGLQESILKAINQTSSTSYVFSTYSALFACRKILINLQAESKTGLKGNNVVETVKLGD